MKNTYSLFLLVFLLIGLAREACSQVSLVPSQPIDPSSSYHTIYKTTVHPSTSYTLSFPAEATSLALQTEASQVLNDVYILAGKDTFLLKEEVHARETNTTGKLTSTLVIFSKPVTSIKFLSGSLSGEVVVHVLNAGQAQLDTKAYRRSQETTDCMKPATISQNIWRTGLPAPAQLPEASQVAHIIVHHSATSNNVTDYTAAVRNIYLYHTQVNGWNDIGYNFLVAPDGTIFEGRDGRDQLEEDNVLGAHFCAKNRGTMGICMLGTFTSTAPTSKALEALVSLTSWKMQKENLNPLNSALHPLNNTSASLLNVLAGHRDGCNTECPGTATYALLPQLRLQVKSQMEACQEPLAQQITIYPQPASRQVFINVANDQEIRACRIYDVTGKLHTMVAGKITTNQVRLDTHSLAAGMYILHVQLGDNTYFTHKLLVL